MEFRNLQSFLRVAELGSFTGAANELGYAQSTVTTHIQQLETELGIPLFEHVGRKVFLTLYGKQLIPYVHQILQIQEQITSLHQTDSSKVKGTLRVGIVESIMNSLLLTNLKTYRKRFPNVCIQIYPAVTSPLFEKLRRNEVDLIFTMGDQVDVPGCVCACSHEERAVFISSPEHPLAHCERLTLAEVLRQPLILTGEITFLRRELAKAAYRCAQELRPVIQTESSNIILRLIEQNLGISFLPEHLVRTAFLQKRIAILPVADYSLPFSVHIFYHKNKFLTPQMVGLIQLIQEFWDMIDRPDDAMRQVQKLIDQEGYTHGCDTMYTGRHDPEGRGGAGAPESAQ